MKLSVYLCEKHKDALAQTSIIVFIRASQKQECQELNCYKVGEYTTIIQTGENQKPKMRTEQEIRAKWELIKQEEKDPRYTFLKSHIGVAKHWLAWVLDEDIFLGEEP
jgi:hypothetical protein